MTERNDDHKKDDTSAIAGGSNSIHIKQGRQIEKDGRVDTKPPRRKRRQ